MLFIIKELWWKNYILVTNFWLGNQATIYKDNTLMPYCVRYNCEGCKA